MLKEAATVKVENLTMFVLVEQQLEDFTVKCVCVREGDGERSAASRGNL